MLELLVEGQVKNIRPFLVKNEMASWQKMLSIRKVLSQFAKSPSIVPYVG
jgi:hypothetical protein